MSCTTDQIASTLQALSRPPKLIITDSQVFHTVYEQKPAEIALALDIPKKQIENRLYYAKQKLKRCWANK